MSRSSIKNLQVQFNQSSDADLYPTTLYDNLSVALFDVQPPYIHFLILFVLHFKPSKLSSSQDFVVGLVLFFIPTGNLVSSAASREANPLKSRKLDSFKS